MKVSPSKREPNNVAGKFGEHEVVRLVPCPNCGKGLMVLPPNYPLFDVQCTGCSFRAQIKTNKSSPKSVVFGAGWQIMHKVLKSGYMVPPLFLHFKWTENGKSKRKILFYPFVPKGNLINYRLSKNARRSNYEMFRYVGMSELPHFVVYER